MIRPYATVVNEVEQEAAEVAESFSSVTPAISCSNAAGLRAALALAVLLLASLGQAQDIEPRRWSHLPIGANFGAAAYAYTTGDIYLDPELKIQNAQFDLHTIAVKYIRSFELLGQSARVDLTQPYQIGHWSGLLNGVPA